MTENFTNFIAGAWVAPRTGAYFENRNPADAGDVIGCFPRSGPEDVARAIESAQRGFARWSQTPAPVRGEVLHRVGRSEEPRLNSSHLVISYAVFCLKKKN